MARRRRSRTRYRTTTSAVPPPPGPGGDGGKGKGGSSNPPKGGDSGSSSGSSGSGSGSSSSGSGHVPGVKYFGQPVTRAQYGQLKQRYNDLARAWLGRPMSDADIKKIINRGISDYQLRIQFVGMKGFQKSPMYKTLAEQASGIVGFEYKPPAKVIKQALKSEGGLSEASYRAALSSSGRVRQAVTRDYMRSGAGGEAQYALGAFGGGALRPAQQRTLALQESGLESTALGKRLQGALQQALEKSQRVFQGQLATGPMGGLQQQQQLQYDEDLPA